MTKNILLAVSGLSPQVITETLYGIHSANQPFPDEIRVITTLQGKDRLVGSFMGPDSKLAAFCRDYNLPEPHFDESCIQVIKDSSGRPVDDASSAEDHGAIADGMIELVRHLTNDSSTIIHASIAGGRKTMTFLLGYAMSLFGRPQDRLSHVLVSAPYEEVNEFYYPTPQDSWRMTRKNQRVNERDAQVTLIDIPFVRMREEMPVQIIKENRGYAETVSQINLALSGSHLPVCLDFNRMKITIGERCISLSSDEFTFYAMMAYRVIENEGKKRGMKRPPKDDYCNEIPIEFLLAFFPPKQRHKLKKHPDIDVAKLISEAQVRAQDIGIKEPLVSEVTRTEIQRHGFSEQLWNRIHNRLKNKLKKELGERMKDLFGIRVLDSIKTGGKPIEIKGLKLQPEQIKMIP